MYLTLYRLALPGGRRLAVVLYPAKPEPKETVPSVKRAAYPAFDRTLAQFGSSTGLPPDAGLPKALKYKR